MAITVLLALLGAFILSLTLIPVLTSYFVKPSQKHEETRLLRAIHRLYVPLLGRLMRMRTVVISGAVVSLSLAVFLFTRLGAEFIPQLDEGDVLLEVQRLPGVALSESVATDLRIERALKYIPEVTHVVARAGSPELATDPMGINQSDVYIGLKAHKQWRDNLTKSELSDEIASAVDKAVPEVGVSISQPIQMRTNELVAGFRSDVAILIYGPDLEVLKSLGDKTANVVRGIPGAVDVRVEQVAGLRYLRIRPDRAKLSRYGLTIDDVNQITQTLAVGHSVGEVLEGERRFGMVIKMQTNFQGDLNAINAMPLRSVTGQIVPLGDVATLQWLTGPAQVGRANQSRRLSVEFNVRGRDVISVVEDAQRAVGNNIKLPTTYRTEWGGQFEHYQEAKARLLWVVPLALGLIMFLLWLAFRSLRTALLIFLNVPFAIVGGVLALYLRDIPFSISAGIGFIALFGVAVLNGLVLVSFARHLEEQGKSHIDAIREAAELRLRPVLMTALVASLGFLPMALSNAPGSEVQRPLATVVIGGLITATLLTMLVLPVIVAWLGKTMALKENT